MLSGPHATGLAGSSTACRLQGPQRCVLHSCQPPTVLRRMCRALKAVPDLGIFNPKRLPGQVSDALWFNVNIRILLTCCQTGYTFFVICRLQGGRHVSLTSCAAAAAEQPEAQLGQGVTKRCLMCGGERTLFYFPVRKSHPGGWVHCYACQREQRQKIKPFSGCATMGPLSAAGSAACRVECVCSVFATPFASLDDVLVQFVLLWPSLGSLMGPTIFRLGATRRLSGACIPCRPREGEHSPTQEDQVCKKCHKNLPARWYGLAPTHRSGRDSTCIACRKAQRRALISGRQWQTPEQKQCRRCQQIKAAECFHRQASSLGGLHTLCKECNSAASKSHKQALAHVEVPTKHCFVCQMVKPAGDFCRRRRAVDGLAFECAECTIRRQRRLRGQ